MKVPEKVGGSIEPRKLGNGDSSNASGPDRASTSAGLVTVRDRVSKGLGSLLGQAYSQASARREERMEHLRRSIADGTYRPDLAATADGLASDARLMSALHATLGG
ncbi:MAG: hypothetical protein RL199_765 [Pseudomonadota bacterium]|jgi:anti-sigma28 factor (negative regulator of flagellin synthesis)